MTPTNPKKKGCLAGQPKRSAPVKVQIATGESIRLSAKHKKILSRTLRFVGDALDCLNEIDNNVVRGERDFFAINVALLRGNLGGCRRLCRAVAAVAQHAKRQEVRS